MTANSHLIVGKIILLLFCLVDLGGFPLGHAINYTKISQTKVKVGSQQQSPNYTHVTESRLILILSLS